jgi:RNA polymerase sigma factor (TIGR02999 family)
VTILLDAASAGDANASAKLLPVVYEQLRRLAQSNMNKERPGMTLQPTALVHEAYMRLLGPTGKDEVQYQNRGHFFAMAALAMRRILVERARKRDRVKHGGDRARVDMPLEALSAEPASTDLLALDEALKKLEKEDERRYNVVMLRYFAGLSIEDTAAAMKISPATVKTDWAVARVWLYRIIQGENERGDEESK